MSFLKRLLGNKPNVRRAATHPVSISIEDEIDFVMQDTGYERSVVESIISSSLNYQEKKGAIEWED